MNIQVRYFTKTGNTKTLAQVIADELGTVAQPMGRGTQESADLLFLGASVYWAGIDGVVKAYIDQLDPAKVKKVAVFSTSALAQRGFPAIRKRLADRGIAVAEENFYCRGQFKGMHQGRPNQDDQAAARAFARSVAGK